MTGTASDKEAGEGEDWTSSSPAQSDSARFNYDLWTTVEAGGRAKVFSGRSDCLGRFAMDIRATRPDQARIGDSAVGREQRHGNSVPIEGRDGLQGPLSSVCAL